jgi:hypothetical protein
MNVIQVHILIIQEKPKVYICKQHKKANMICVTQQLCIEKNCITRPSFNLVDETKGLY